MKPKRQHPLTRQVFCIGMWLSAWLPAIAADTNQVTLAETNLRGTVIACRASEKQLRADVKWDISKVPIPLDPGRAFTLAQAWARKQEAKTELLRIEILPLARRSEGLEGHYYYVFEFNIADGWHPPFPVPVVVLMDGTVIEPH